MKNQQIKLPLFFTAFLMVAFLHQSVAQTDPHFTQNYTYPMYINPALTGGSDGEYRVSSIYRSQWGGFVFTFGFKNCPYKPAAVKYSPAAKY